LTDTLDLLIGLMILEFLMMIPVIAFARLGGWPEGFYRIFRIKYFAFRYLDADLELRKAVLRWTEIKVHSPAYFDFRGRRFYIDKLNTIKANGRASWLYPALENGFPFPLVTMDRQSVDSEAIREAFNSKQLKDYLHARERGAIKEESHLLRNIGIVGIFIMLLLFLLGGFKL